MKILSLNRRQTNPRIDILKRKNNFFRLSTAAGGGKKGGKKLKWWNFQLFHFPRVQFCELKSRFTVVVSGVGVAVEQIWIFFQHEFELIQSHKYMNLALSHRSSLKLCRKRREKKTKISMEFFQLIFPYTVRSSVSPFERREFPYHYNFVRFEIFTSFRQNPFHNPFIVEQCM